MWKQARTYHMSLGRMWNLNYNNSTPWWSFSPQESFEHMWASPVDRGRRCEFEKNSKQLQRNFKLWDNSCTRSLTLELLWWRWTWTEPEFKQNLQGARLSSHEHSYLRHELECGSRTAVTIRLNVLYCFAKTPQNGGNLYPELGGSR